MEGSGHQESIKWVLCSIKLSSHESWLLISQTLVNSNQNRFPLDSLHTFTVILPSLTQTLKNLNLPLTRSIFSSPSDNFYVVLPLTTWTMTCFGSVTISPKKWEMNLFQNDHVFFVFTSSSVSSNALFSPVIQVIFCHLLISLFSAIFFKILIIQLVFDSPRRFDLSGVNCTYTCMRNSVYQPSTIMTVYGPVIRDNQWLFHILFFPV